MKDAIKFRDDIQRHLLPLKIHLDKENEEKIDKIKDDVDYYVKFLYDCRPHYQNRNLDEKFDAEHDVKSLERFLRDAMEEANEVVNAAEGRERRDEGNEETEV